MARLMNDDQLTHRLAGARPGSADATEHQPDAALLARLQTQPIAPRRTMASTVAAPAAAGLALAAAGTVMLVGGPGGGPSAAAAIGQTLNWLTPPAHTVLHARSVESAGGHQSVREIWQSADEPSAERMRTEGRQAFETARDGIYDPATNTIYDTGKPPEPSETDVAKKKQMDASRERIAGGEAKKGVATGGPVPAEQKSPDHPELVADPIVGKVRSLLMDERATVLGRVRHDGQDAWAIGLKPGEGRPTWTLWVSTADGKPLELRDPGRDAGDPPQVVRWSSYEVLPETSSSTLVTLRGAHPSAHVVTDRAQASAAAERLTAP